jgi:hypothetical protein
VHGLFSHLAVQALHRIGKPHVHPLQRIPLKDVRIVPHLSGLVAREELSVVRIPDTQQGVKPL